MESLLKQLRARYSGLGQENQEENLSLRGPKVPAKKSVSFEEDKKVQNWFRKQFSVKMSTGEDSDQDSTFVTAVAAAAFAITMLEESSSLNRRKSGKGMEASQMKSKSKKEGSMAGPSDYGGPSRMQLEATPDQKTPERITLDQKLPEKNGETIPITRKTPTMGRVPTTGKTPSFTEKYRNDEGSKKQETTKNMKPGQHGDMDAKAAAWKESKMVKINKRYEKLKITIQSWENKKKAKAKRRFDRNEREMEQRRAHASQEYKDEISRIESIAEGAKTQAEERKRNEESKVNEKVQNIRSTGTVPVTCSCF